MPWSSVAVDMTRLHRSAPYDDLIGPGLLAVAHVVLAGQLDDGVDVSVEDS